MTKKNKKQSKDFEKIILGVLKENSKKSLNYKQISSKLKISNGEKRKLIIASLHLLHKKDKITETEPGKYQIIINNQEAIGILDVSKGGQGFLIQENVEEDILIPNKHLKNALNGDKIRIEIEKNRGKVIEVIERARTRYTGTIQLSKKFAFVLPTNPKIHVDFFVPIKDTNYAKDGQKVVVEIVSWTNNEDSPTAKVIKILGEEGETNAEVHAILEDFQLPYEFPSTVLQAADKLNQEIPNDEIKKRLDYRNITTLTIDPDDAKDFDDALSIQKLENDNWEVGIHIADVSHYITPNSILDKEALSRSTSVYLVDRVVPMLPEVLSNQLCSLRPNEEKLTFSVIFELDDNANIKNTKLAKTIICSDRRFTYQEAQDRIEGKDGDYKNEVLTLHKLASKIRKKRVANGAIEIESEEVRFKLDDNGNPIGIKIKVSKEANHLIEEFMLLANKYVATLAGKPEQDKITFPFVYRVHDKPNPDKLSDLQIMLSEMGYTLRMQKGKSVSFAINEVMKEAKEKGELALIGPMVIKSMAKAIYSNKNNGHYGLGFDYYSHFTSPIRRYPDLEIHRILYKYLQNDLKSVKSDDIANKCKHFSAQERKAVDAERASIKFMQVKYIKDKVGMGFKAKVSGFNDKGIFAEIIENKCEGFIYFNEIGEDRYIYDSSKHIAIGKMYHKKIRMGDEIDVIVKKVNMQKRYIDLILREQY